MMNDEPFKNLAKKYNVTEAQILLRWSLQNELIPLPKSATPSRIESNIDLFAFNLDDSDMKLIKGLDKDMATQPWWDPRTCEYTSDGKKYKKELNEAKEKELNEAKEKL